MKTKKLESVYVNALHQSECRRPTMPVMTQIGKSQKKVTWLCDTGAEVSVMGLNQLKTFKDARKKPSDVALFGAGHKRMGEVGKVQATWTNENGTYRGVQNGVHTEKTAYILTTTPPIPTIPGTSHLFG